MKISNPKYNLKDVGLMEKATDSSKKPSNYKLVCELSYGGTPIDWQWAISTEVYKKIEKQI